MENDTLKNILNYRFSEIKQTNFENRASLNHVYNTMSVIIPSARYSRCYSAGINRLKKTKVNDLEDLSKQQNSKDVQNLYFKFLESEGEKSSNLRSSSMENKEKDLNFVRTAKFAAKFKTVIIK